MKRMRRALSMAAVTAVIPALAGVPHAQAASPETQLAGYAPAVATAAINGLVERKT
jgi:hypothetical protein